MDLCDQAVYEFQALYQSQYGQDLDFESAKKIGTNLIVCAKLLIEDQTQYEKEVTSTKQ